MAEKTEQPTEKKLRDARKRGEVPRSQDVTSAVSLLGGALVASSLGTLMVQGVVACWYLSLGQVRSLSRGAETAPVALAHAWSALARPVVGPFLLVLGFLAAVALLATFLQVGALVSVKALFPKLERLNPVQGFQRLFSPRQGVELIKAMVKLVAVSWVLWVALRSGARQVSMLAGQPVEAAALYLRALGTSSFLKVGGVMVALGTADYFFQRWWFLREQRMTKAEVKREFKEQEGDPEAKQRRDAAYREIVEHGVMEAVRDADVLVVNPTHVAVALKFEEQSDMEAPELVAKGQDGLAKRMIAAAQAAGVPVMRNVPLARSLYSLDLGDEIPENLYETVAVILQEAWDEREQHGGSSAE